MSNTTTISYTSCAELLKKVIKRMAELTSRPNVLTPPTYNVATETNPEVLAELGMELVEWMEKYMEKYIESQDCNMNPITHFFATD